MQTEAETQMRRRVAQHPFLAGLTQTQLTLLTDCAFAGHFKKSETIIREGKHAQHFFLIEKGKVVLESGEGFGETVVVETIGPGDLLGWSWMFPPYLWHFTARAVEPTDVIFFNGTILRQYCETDHSLGHELHKRMSAVMSRRLQAARKKMLGVHAYGEKLEPAVGRPPFMEQELDTYDGAPEEAID